MGLFVPKMHMKQGNFSSLTVGQICQLQLAYGAGQLKPNALRAYLAAHEVATRRKITEWKAGHQKAEEYAQIADLPVISTKQALKQLQKTGLLSINKERIHFLEEYSTKVRAAANALSNKQENADSKAAERPVPIPRPILIALARENSPKRVLAVLGHLIRALFKKCRREAGRGFVKSDLICQIFNISQATVSQARRWMIEKGMIQVLEQSQQMKNRFGLLFQVNLNWKAAKKGAEKTGPTPSKTGQKNSPYINNQLLRSNNNQQKTGVQGPNLKRFTSEDLKRVRSVLELYKQAVFAGWLHESRANQQNCVAAAVRALSCGAKNPMGVFISILKNQLWSHITQAQEDRANAALKRFEQKQKASRNLPEEATQGAISGKVEKLLQDVSGSLSAAC